MEGFGKPKYTSDDYVKVVRPKEDTALEFRILPPMKSLAESGTWRVYLGQHFGFKGVNPRDPTKTIHRTFKCVESRDFQTKAVLQPCPACEEIYAFRDRLEAAEVKAKSEGKSEEEIKEIIGPFKKWLKEFNCDRKWYMNVKLMSGQFAVLAISNKTMKELKSKIDSLLKNQGIDSLDLDSGVWFRITRTGKGIQVDDSVEYIEEVFRMDNGRTGTTVKLAPMSEDEARAALAQCPDLSKFMTELTESQIKALVKCSGDPEEVDKIFSLGIKVRTPAAESKREAPAAVTAPSEPAPKSTAEEDLQKKLAELQAQLVLAQKASGTLPVIEAKSEKPDSVTRPESLKDVEKADAPVPAKPSSSSGIDIEAFMRQFKQQ